MSESSQQSGALQGQVVVITGASAGIGAALAKVAGARGAKVVLLARREAELKAVAAESGPDALTIVADVTKRADVERAVAQAISHFGHVDALVNNAGRGISRSVAELTDEDVDDMMLVNVKSVLYGIQAVLPHFQARGTGHIVNVSSMLGRLPLAGVRSAYGAAKHALNSLTASLRNDLRQTHPGIHVSLVLPGIVATDFGVNARHGGLDSRQAPGAQAVGEVATLMADLLEHPRAELFTRPPLRDLQRAWYGAEDVGAFEAASPAFSGGGPRRP